MITKFAQQFDLNGKVAVITGGAGLLGVKHAEAILEGNGKAVLVDINKKALAEKLKTLQIQYSQKVWGYVLDITNEKDIIKTVNRIIKEAGKISILINNACNNPRADQKKEYFTRLENLSLGVWNKDFAVGLTGAFLMSRIIGPKMAENSQGVILNIASDLGVIAPDQRIYAKKGLKKFQQPVKPVSYSVVKHGIIGLTKYLATYWAEQGVRVNCLSPGGVYYGQPLEKEFIKSLTNLIPMARMAGLDEYKGAVLFLCSDASSYMTGANLVMDGGRTCW